jgi:steroid 5-alpha reductase family enzyme
MINVVFIQAAVIVCYMSVWFIIAQTGKRNDVADVAWGTGFIVTAVTSMILSKSVSPRGYLVLLLVLFWGIRLAVHIHMRNRGKPEDRRYKKWREEWGKHGVIRAYVQVFVLQGLLMVIISLPVTHVILFGQTSLSIIDLLGILVWMTGYAFEVIGDYQLLQYKKDPSSRGKIMKTGLWRYTRHPNYFGEVTLWWGMYVIAFSVSNGWMTIAGPLTITFLILKVSGIPLLEEKYKDNPEFQTYKRRTSAFFPLPPGKET